MILQPRTNKKKKSKQLIFETETHVHAVPVVHAVFVQHFFSIVQHKMFTFACKKIHVGTLKVQSIPANWKPEGVAVNSKDTVAVTEGTNVNLVCMETSYNAGQLVKVVDNLEAPHGLCPSRTEGTVFVADGHSIKEINLKKILLESVAMDSSRRLMLHCE